MKIGANYVELILGLEIMGRKPTFFMVMGRKQPICWSQVDLSDEDETHFPINSRVDCRAFESERILVGLRWHTEKAG